MKGMNDVMAKRNGSRWPLAVITLAIALAGADMAAAGSLTNTAVANGRPARSYPAKLPIFRLDRIYVRGFAIERSEVHFGAPWSKISDHAALSAHIQIA